MNTRATRWAAAALMLLVAALVGGCDLLQELGLTGSSSGTSDAAAPPPARLLPEGEVDRLVADVVAVAEANVAKSCPRPVLRGEATPGRADEAMLMLLEPEGDLAACLAAAGDGAVETAIDIASGEATVPPRARSLGDAEARSVPTRAVEKACRGLAGALTAAVAHEDACSPYLMGRRPMPRSLSVVMHLSRAVVVLARKEARERRAVDGVRLLLDALRFQQDLARGGTSWIYSMVSIAASKTLIRHAAVLILEGSLSTEDRGAVAVELEKLAASEPHVSGPLTRDLLEADLYLTIPKIKGPKWVPPGGWPADMTAGAESAAVEDATAEQLGVVLLATREISEKWALACGVDDTALECNKRVAEVEAGLAERGKPGALNALDLLTTTSADGMRKKTLRMVLDILEGVAGPDVGRYLERATWRSVGLAGLRLQLELAARPAKGCPRLTAFDAEPLVDLRDVPALGARLVILPAPGGFWVAPPEALETHSEADNRYRMHIVCRAR